MASGNHAPIAPGTLCQNCVKYPATHQGRLDRGGPLFLLCDECEEPAREGHGIERGYEPSGGLPTAPQATRGARLAMGDAAYEAETARIQAHGRAPGKPADRDDIAVREIAADSIRRARTRANGYTGRHSSRTRTTW